MIDTNASRIENVMMERLISLILFTVFALTINSPAHAKNFHKRVVSAFSFELSQLVVMEAEVYEPEERKESKFDFALSSLVVCPAIFFLESLDRSHFSQCQPLSVSQGDIFRSTDIPPPHIFI